MGRVKNKDEYIFEKRNGNLSFDTGEVVEEEIVRECGSIKSLHEFLDKEDPELLIFSVSAMNNSMQSEKTNAAILSFFAGLFAIITVKNVISIINGDNINEIFNYVITTITAGLSIFDITKIVKHIKHIFSIKPLVESGNEYVMDKYPEKAENACIPKTFIKKFKKNKQNKKEEN